MDFKNEEVREKIKKMLLYIETSDEKYYQDDINDEFIWGIINNINSDADDLLGIVMESVKESDPEIDFLEISKDELLYYLKSKSILFFKNDNNKLNLLPTIEDDSDRLQIIISLSSDEEKINFIDNLESIRDKVKIIETITNKDLSNKLMNKLIVDLSKTNISVDELNDEVRLNVIKNMDYRDEDIKVMIIKTIESEKIKVKCLEYVTADWKRLKVIEQIKSDELKFSCLDYLTDDWKRVEVIEQIKSDELKNSALDYLTDDYYKVKIIKNLVNDKMKIKALDKVEDDASKLEVILELVNANDMIEALDKVDGDSYKLKIIYFESSNMEKHPNMIVDDENKIKVLDKLKGDVHKLRLMESLSSTSIMLKNLNKLADDKNKIKIISMLTEADRIIALDYLKQLDSKIKVIETLTDENKMLFLKSCSSVDIILRTISLLKQKSDIIKVLYDVFDKLEEAKASSIIIDNASNDDEKIYFINRMSFDQHKSQVILTLEDENNKIQLLSAISSVELKASVIVTLKEDKNKMNFMSEISSEELKTRVIVTLQEDKNKMNSMSEISSEELKTRVIVTLKSEENRFQYLSIFSSDDNKLQVISTCKDLDIMIKSLEYLESNASKLIILEKIVNKPEYLSKVKYILENNLATFNQVLEAWFNLHKMPDNYKIFIENNAELINNSDIEARIELIEKLEKINQSISQSNSLEFVNFAPQILNVIFSYADYEEKLAKIESMFLKNNIPNVGKKFSVFKILNQEYSRFNTSKLSPVLKQYNSNNARDIIIFSDLLRITAGSNNRAFLKYIKNIEEGNDIYLRVFNDIALINDLSTEEKQVLTEFLMHIRTLYENTRAGKKENLREISGNLIEDITEIRNLFLKENIDNKDLPDKIIRMFFHFSGIKTIEDLKKHCSSTIKNSDERNRAASESKFTVKKGDLIKGIGDIRYLGNILQNGSVAKEFLGDAAASDFTPLDTDLTMFLEDSDSDSDELKSPFSNVAASGYGSIFFIVKKKVVIKEDGSVEDVFNITRSSDCKENKSSMRDLSKLELFYTGVDNSKNKEDHYGIRTGFASSDIDYIVIKDESLKSKVALEIVKNGFYIPVIDSFGKLIFSANEYDELRSKMAGLSEYNLDDYTIDESISYFLNDEIRKSIISSIDSTINKKKCVVDALKEAMSLFGLEHKNHIDNDLSTGSYELIDTGSTGRFTNLPGDGDFDFIMRLDKIDLQDPKKLSEIKEKLREKFSECEKFENTENGDFRIKKAKIEGLSEPIDIDITFAPKTDKISYTTDMCLEDRLSSIKKQYPDKYYDVIANIVLAKKILKDAGVYKARQENGFGGVGVENWILQNGGSVYAAFRSFLDASKDRNLEEFKKVYSIWDFGENHVAINNSGYPHDNFVELNLIESSYVKMREVLKKYMVKEKKYTEENSEIQGVGRSM